MNYRSHFQPTIIKLQRMLDDAQYHGDWGAYLRLRHRIIQLKDHIVDHEERCGYYCSCQPEEKYKHLVLKNK